MRTIFFKSLTISLLLHLLGGFLFQVKLSSKYLPYIKPSNITFIGAILPAITSTDLIRMQDLRFPQHLHRRKIKLNQDDLIEPLKEKLISKFRLPRKMDVYLNEIEIISSITGLSSLTETQNKNVNLVDTRNFELKGNWNDRKVVYRPNILEIKDLIVLYSTYGTPVFRVQINPQGKVQKVTILETSGNSIIDVALKNYFRQWIFEPIFRNKIEERIIRLNLSSIKFNYD